MPVLERLRGTFQMEFSFHQHLFRLIGFRSPFYQPSKCLFNKYGKQIFASPPSVFRFLFCPFYPDIFTIQIFNNHFKQKKKKTLQFASFVLSLIFLIFLAKGGCFGLISTMQSICIQSLYRLQYS